MPSPKLVPLLLSGAERESLEALVRKRTASQSLALRARIGLACAEGGGGAQVTAVAEQTGVSRESVRKCRRGGCGRTGEGGDGVGEERGVWGEWVGKWRVRFAESRMKGLTDAARPGAPRKITDEQVEVVVTRVLTEKGPGQDTHWSTRAMAAETGLSQS